MGEGVDDGRHLDHQRLECRIHRIGNRIHRTFHCGKQKAECAAKPGIHLFGGGRRNSFHILELGQHRIQFIGIRRQRQSGKRSANIKDIFSKRQLFSGGHCAHCLGDVPHDLSHFAEVPVCVDCFHAHGTELILNFHFGKLRETLAQSRSGERSFDAHVRKNCDRRTGFPNRLSGGRRLRSAHFQRLKEVNQCLRRTVRSDRENIGDITHL